MGIKYEAVLPAKVHSPWAAGFVV